MIKNILKGLFIGAVCALGVLLISIIYNFIGRINFWEEDQFMWMAGIMAGNLVAGIVCGCWSFIWEK